MQKTLTIGSIHFKPSSSVIVSDESGTPLAEHGLPVLRQPELGSLSEHRHGITKVVVGFIELASLNFLAYLPNVTDVWLMSQHIGDISGLAHLKQLRSLVIDRPSYRLDILRQLRTLESLYIDCWHPSAEGIFEISGLKKLSIQKYGLVDLQRMGSLSQLSELWLNAGKLETLDGIPPSLKVLRLTSLRKFRSIEAIGQCRDLLSFTLDTCTQVTSLHGLDNCRKLNLLSIIKVGRIDSLEPLRDLSALSYLVLVTSFATSQIDVLYTLHSLHDLIITDQVLIDSDKLHASAPGCRLTLAQWRKIKA